MDKTSDRVPKTGSGRGLARVLETLEARECAMKASELARLLGVTRQQIYQVGRRQNNSFFPCGRFCALRIQTRLRSGSDESCRSPSRWRKKTGWQFEKNFLNHLEFCFRGVNGSSTAGILWDQTHFIELISWSKLLSPHVVHSSRIFST